jgi:hypothetical protein
MRSLVLGLLVCWICVVPEAYALSGSQGPTTKGQRSVTAKTARSGGARAGYETRLPSTTRTNSSQLLLETPSKVHSPQSSAVETITSLANGSAPLNPWVPERGAIGVRVKVTW